MIYFKFIIKRKYDDFIDFKNYYVYSLELTKHKFFEFQIMYYYDSYFSLELEIIFSGRDHAGPRLTISFLGYILDFSIFDNRHWNKEKNEWKTDF